MKLLHCATFRRLIVLASCIDGFLKGRVSFGLLVGSRSRYGVKLITNLSAKGLLYQTS